MNSSIKKRILSALILMPVVLGTTILGYPWFDFLLGFIATVAITEWFLIPQRAPISYKIINNKPKIVYANLEFAERRFSTITMMNKWAKAGLFFLTITFLVSLNSFYYAYIYKLKQPAFISLFELLSEEYRYYHLIFIFIISLLILVVALLEKVRAVFLCFVGFLYICAAYYSILWLRYQTNEGFYNVLWLFLIVWATDIFAMAIGKKVKGPRLAPRISPNKTWSGLVGGMIAASTVSFIFAYMQDSPYLLLCTVLGAVFGIIEQMGDLLESMLKRKFGVKDSSQLIPGHGGVLDRIDGLLLLSICMALIFYFLKIEWWKLA